VRSKIAEQVLFTILKEAVKNGMFDKHQYAQCSWQ